MSGDIQLLSENLVQGLTTMLGAFDMTIDALMKSENPIVKAVGSLLHFITTTGKSIAEKLPDILAIIEKALPYIEANLVSKALFGEGIMGVATSLISGIVDIFMAAKLIRGGSTAANVAANVAGGGATAGAASGGVGVLTAAGELAGGAALAFAPTALMLAGAMWLRNNA